MSRMIVKCGTLVAAACFAVSLRAWAGNGDIDGAYADQGLASLDLLQILDASHLELGVSLDAPGQGQYLVGTIVSEQIEGVAFVARLNSKGHLDTTYAGGAGIARVAFSEFGGFGDLIDFRVRSASIAADGGILLAALLHEKTNNPLTETRRPAVCKLDASGILDVSFGNQQIPGCRILPFEAPDIVIGGQLPLVGIAQSSSGDYIVVASRANGDSSDVVVVRLGQAGNIDYTFGVDGFFILGTDTPLVANHVAIKPDGRIVVAATFVVTHLDYDIVVLQIASDGLSYQSYTVPIDLSNEYKIDLPHALAIRPNGTIVVGGTASTSLSTQAAILFRLSDTLAPVASIGSQFPPEGMDSNRRAFKVCDSCSDQRVTSFKSLPDGGFLIAGDFSFYSDRRIFVKKLLPDWTLDPSFASSGTQYVDFDSLNEDVDDSSPKVSTQCGDRPVIAALHGDGSPGSRIGATRLLGDTIYCDFFEDVW